MPNLIIEIVITLLILLFFIAYCFYLSKKRDKLLQEGRPVIAEIINIRSVGGDGAGNTTIAYVLDVEGHLLKETEKIDTFYAPQFQKGKKIMIHYKNDKNYKFVFDK